MLKYPARSLRAFTFLFRPYNDLDVYVEDTACRNVYEVIINRILSPKASVARIFQIGNRDQVLEECRKQQGQFSRPCIFIIDADFDLATGAAAPALERLCRLDVYCFENFLFCKTAASEVSYECLNNMPRVDMEHALEFDEFAVDVGKHLHNLFVVYATARLLDESLETSGRHVYTLCKQDAGQPVLDKAKVRACRRDMLKSLCSTHPKNDVADTCKGVIRAVEDAGLTWCQLVSGKTYLIPLLLSRLRKIAHYRGDQRTLMVQLSKHCDLTNMATFREAVQVAARTPVSNN